MYASECMANMVNGEIVTNSESDKPEQYIGINNILSENGCKLVKKTEGCD